MALTSRSLVRLPLLAIAVLALLLGPVAGAEAVLCHTATAHIVGSNSNDDLPGTSGQDRIAALGGRDKANGYEDVDWICGDNGDDDIGTGLEGGLGADRLWGGNGQDFLDGGGGPDDLYGEDDPDFLSSGGGDDLLKGEAGTDALIGGDGDDELQGGGGDDYLDGGDGADVLEGGPGSDICDGGPGIDTLLSCND